MVTSSAYESNAQAANQNSPNSLDDSKRDICLLPEEYYEYWPSMKEASELRC